MYIGQIKLLLAVSDGSLLSRELKIEVKKFSSSGDDLKNRFFVNSYRLFCKSSLIITMRPQGVGLNRVFRSKRILVICS